MTERRALLDSIKAAGGADMTVVLCNRRPSTAALAPSHSRRRDGPIIECAAHDR